jgi:hypothetical protein
MKHLYNTIRPVGKRAIVAIVDGEKNKHTITDENGKEVELFVDTSFSWDGKVANHTQATLLTDFKNLKAGTHVLIYHNAIHETNQLDIWVNPLTRIHAIEDSSIYFGFDGEKIICVDGYLLAERIYEDDSTEHIIAPDKRKVDNVLRIVGKPDSVDDFEIGDLAVVYKYSDYEITHNLNGRRVSVIRLKYSDCLGKA